MERLLVPILILGVLVSAACGGAAEPTPASPAPAGEVFAVRPAGQSGPLISYDGETRRRRFELPRGTASADGRSFFVAAAGELRRYDVATGALLARHPIGRGWRLGGVSPEARWVALARSEDGATRVRVLDTHDRRVVHEVRLSGRFEVDAVAADGRALFLIEHETDDTYRVWLYDVGTRDLSSPGATRPKARPQLMTGYAWGGVASTDGRWLLTLYLNTRRDVAFVHALDVAHRRPLCIDLPSGGGRADTLERYALALAPNGRTLLAPNPALGLVAEIDLSRLRVVRTRRLAAGETARGAVEAARGAVSAVGRDGALYVASGPRVWRSVRAGAARPWDVGGEVTGLAVSRTGSRVYVVRADDRVLVLDALTGAAL